MSVRRLQDFDNTNFGSLDSAKDKDVVFFNRVGEHSTSRILAGLQ